MSTTRKILFLLFFLGFASNIGGAGTMASFNASTTNAQSTFASGSIVLSNTNEFTEKVCFSNGTGETDGGEGTATDDNHNDGCEAAFNVAARKPGDTAEAELTLKNEGNLAGTLSLLVANHTPPGGGALQTACSVRDAGDTVYHGDGDICERLQLTIQRWTTPNRDVAHSCVYPASAGTCAADLNSNLKTFTAAASHVSPGISIDALQPSGSTSETETYDHDNNVGTAEIPVPEDAAWFTITVAFPDGAPFPGVVTTDNVYQGLVATMAVQWILEQAA